MGCFSLKFKTVFEALRDNGYVIGYTAKGWAPGVATNAQGQPRLLTGPVFDKLQSSNRLRPDMAPNDYSANFADFLDAAPLGQPWWCFWYEAAMSRIDPTEAGSGAAKGPAKRPPDIERVPGIWPDNETVQQRYASL